MCREETSWAVFPSSGVRTIFSAADILLLLRMEKASAKKVDRLCKSDGINQLPVRQFGDELAVPNAILVPPVLAEL